MGFGSKISGAVKSIGKKVTNTTAGIGKKIVGVEKQV